MTGQAADRLLQLGDGDAALLYLHLLRGSQAASLGWTEDRRAAAFDRLLQIGLAQDDQRPVPETKPEPDTVPEYTTADLTRELESDPVFAGLTREMERRLGKLMSTADLKILFSLYDYLDLPAEVILLLTTWTVQQFQKKYGAERRPRMAQIRQEAYRWHRQGVTTAEAAEEYLRKLSMLEEREQEVLALLGMQGRVPVDRERKYMDAWIEQGFDNDALTLAYEKTVMKKGVLDWNYMNGILRRWHEKGLHTVAAVNASDSDYPRRGASGKQPGAIHEPKADEVQSSVEHMRRLIHQNNPDKEG